VVKADEHLVRLDARHPAAGVERDLSHQAAFPEVYKGSLWLLVYPREPQIWRLDPGTLTPSDTVTLPKGFPFGLSAGDGALWAADHDHGVVWRVDPATGEAKRLARIAHHPIAIAEGEGAVWVGVQAAPLR
jgi:hypothetical protein